ncbi:hypothetical protein JYU11_02310, partial [bacterium AH-315-G05]|nr:hypothetical protein [bacterium AH-315-G05]
MALLNSSLARLYPVLFGHTITCNTPATKLIPKYISNFTLMPLWKVLQKANIGIAIETLIFKTTNLKSKKLGA